MKKKNNGTGLENFVFELYKDLGYLDVTKNVRIKNDLGSNAQIDIVYTTNFFVKRYVECKQHYDSKVSFDEYAKFESVLRMFNIPLYLGEIVTNSYFDKRTMQRASDTGIKLIDRDYLERLNAKRFSGYRNAIFAFRAFEKFSQEGISEALKYFSRRNLSIDSQLEKYTK